MRVVGATCLKQPKSKSVDLSPTTLSLTSMIMYYITGQRTKTVINMGVNVHRMTRSKDLMETLHKSGPASAMQTRRSSMTTGS